MKIPEPRRMTSGNWFIQMRLSGESITVTAATKKEAIRQAELIKAEHRTGRRTAAQKKVGENTLAEVISRYIKFSEATLSPSTLRGYKMYEKSRFKDFQNKKLDNIDFQLMIDKELSEFSVKTCKNGWGLVHAALVHIGYPVPVVKFAKSPVNEIAFLQPEEILPFCKALEGRSYEIPLLLELHGLRMSEALGLDWSRVNLEKKTITIRGAKVRGVDGYITKETNKNASSARTVPIMIPQLVRALEAVEDKTGSVVKITPPGLLADTKRTCERAGVTVVTNHGLRHSFASLCYHLGINERQLMSWGGWSDYHTMHKIYIRLAASDEQKASTVISSFFEPKKS